MRNILFLAILTTLLGSCNFVGGERIRGNGNVISQSRSVNGDFKAIEVSGAIHVYVTQEATSSVKVETDENLQEFVETYVDGQKLVIREANNTNLSPSKAINVYVSGAEFVSFDASGACKIEGKNRMTTEGRLEVDLSGASNIKLDLTSSSVDIEMSGACEVTLAGQTKIMKIDGSGSSDVKAFDLVADDVEVDISGAGNVNVTANTRLGVEASGAATVRYKGSPAVRSNVSGAGSVKQVD